MSDNVARYAKPLPEMQGLTREFYAHCKRHELCFQRCLTCGAWRHIPRELCDTCSSDRWEWARSSGRGEVFSWTIVHRALNPAFSQDVPYAAVIVEMQEGVRVLSHIVDCRPDEVHLNMAVEVVYDDVTPEVTLPKFRRLG